MARKKNYEELVLTRESWGNDLWKVVGETLHTLTREGYACAVYDDDVDIIVIQYNYRDINMSGIELCWESVDCPQEDEDDNED